MSRIVRNTTAVGAAFIVNTFLTFAQLKLLTRYLSQAEFGEYITTFSIGALASVFAQIGLPMVVLRFTAKYDALQHFARMRRLVTLAWGLVALLGLVLVSVERALLADLLGRLYEQPPEIGYVQLATVVFIFVALRQVTYACFDGLRRMQFPALFENLNIAVITIGLLLMRHRLSLDLIFGLAATSGALMWMISSVLLWRVMPRAGRQTPPGAQSAAPVVPDITPFWSGAAMNALVGICFGYADRFVLSLFVSSSVVSVFAIAERLTFLMKRLLALPLQVASPEITRRWELGHEEQLRVDIGFLMKVQLAVAVLVASIATVAAEAGVMALSNDSFLESANLLRVLCVSVVLMALYGPITTWMRAIERIHLALISDVLWITIYLGSAVALVPRFGLPGIVVAQVMASTCAAIYNFAVARIVGRIVLDLRGMLAIVGLGSGLALAGWWIGRLVGLWPVQIVVALALAVVYNVLIVRTGALSADDRRRFGDLAGSSRLGTFVDRMLFWPLRGTRRQHVGTSRDGRVDGG